MVCVQGLGVILTYDEGKWFVDSKNVAVIEGTMSLMAGDSYIGRAEFLCDPAPRSPST